jgi:hypothetical protein
MKEKEEEVEEEGGGMRNEKNLVLFYNFIF